ncbi:Uncharacterised protein (plasmid) [Legionella adelaidensis]|uniref:Aminoglycoside phosphotransferase domain-containing protein n=1 Tax=Legionella adelaidensis TaxID=45056 RepID=A0A0W0R4T4_9GAMM|nr:phosphotransferase [Legionella adelaidensis]KTC66077.1 hypothetical protein Lade_0735 [Legionella adelaidensis]VEH85705.1 Uncharacterised protein [Legionella adelaidensis]
MSLDLLNQHHFLAQGSGVNSLALPGISNPKYIIDITNKDAFMAGLTMFGSRTVKAKMTRVILSLLYTLGLLQYVFKKKLINLRPHPEFISLLKDNFQEIAGINIYNGFAKNKNLSFTFQVVTFTEFFYLRVPFSNTAKKLSASELDNIAYLEKMQVCQTARPYAVFTYAHTFPIYAYYGITKSSTRTRLCKQKKQLLEKLVLPGCDYIGENSYFKKLNEEFLVFLNENKNLHEKMVEIYKKNINCLKDVKLKSAFFHGDFSPDNILLKNKNVFLIDFEYANTHFFTCFDLFHYIFKAKGYHKKDIGLKEVKKIEKKIKQTYGVLPYSLENNRDNFIILLHLFIFYLFFILRRYLIDEEVPTNSIYVNKIQENIVNLAGKYLGFQGTQCH